MLRSKKIAVWGLGKHAINRILPAIKKVNGLTLVGVCSRKKNIVKEYSKIMGCYGWTDYNEMLENKELDIIYLATPIGLHAEHGKCVLLAGKNLWSEKPLTCNLSDTEDLVLLSQRKKLVIAEGFMYLYHKQFKEICSRVKEKKFGLIKEVNIKFGFPELENPGFRNNRDLCGGTLWDVGSYSISAALKLFKNEKVIIKYVNRKFSEKYDVDLDGTVILEFSGGAKVISTWRVGSSYKNEIDIWGDKGSLYSNKIFSKVDGDTPVLKYSDAYGVENTYKIESMNQFVEMFKSFLKLFECEKNAEQERKDIMKRAGVMQKIADY